jgi:hypothetical protein|tara:strand:+ start:2129 stop:3010 length:882 start_codon:yes stop_codon:yes gene_type:complete
MSLKSYARNLLLTHPKLNPYRFSPDYTFRFLTSSFRHLPHFLIIGTSKAGKHSVLSYLNQHPDIKAGTKHNVGVYYFDSTFDYKSLSWYKSHFPSKFSKYKIIGEASGTYLNHPLAPQRIKKTLPHVKLINFFRNPVDRAYSAYNHSSKLGWEHSSFDATIKSEIERINLINDNPESAINNVNSVNFLQFSYLRHGHYASNLQNWFNDFKKNQFMHFATEDLDQNYDEIMNSLFVFFNLSEIKLKKENRKNIGIGKGTYPPMKEKTRDFLIDYYKPHNEKLYNLIGKKFTWDK